MATTYTSTRNNGVDSTIEQLPNEIQRDLAWHFLDRLRPNIATSAGLFGTSRHGRVEVTTLDRPSDAPEATHLLVVNRSAFVLAARGDTFRVLKANSTDAPLSTRDQWKPDLNMLKEAVLSFSETSRVNP